MKQLIVNADDYGYCESVNHGIIRAYRDGIVRSTTIMANMPGFDHAIELAKANPGLRVGVHLTLSCYKPLLENQQTLIDERGYFIKENENFDIEEVYQEFTTQIKRVLATGIKITHFDSHHHVHTQANLRPVIERIMKEYGLPFRGGFEYDQAYEPKSSFDGGFYGKKATIESLKSIIASIQDGQVLDIMCHPAYVEKFLYELSSYNVNRIEELDILCSQEIKDFLVANEIELVNYEVLANRT